MRSRGLIVTKSKHTTIRLSDTGRERLDRLAADYGSQVAAIEDALVVLEDAKVAYGQQVWWATAALIKAIRSGDERVIGGAQNKLADLLRSTTAATGIASALREALRSEEDSDGS